MYLSPNIFDTQEGPRTMVGVATFDSAIHFYNLKRAMQQVNACNSSASLEFSFNSYADFFNFILNFPLLFSVKMYTICIMFMWTAWIFIFQLSGKFESLHSFFSKWMYGYFSVWNYDMSTEQLSLLTFGFIMFTLFLVHNWHQTKPA